MITASISDVLWIVLLVAIGAVAVVTAAIAIGASLAQVFIVAVGLPWLAVVKLRRWRRIVRAAGDEFDGEGYRYDPVHRGFTLRAYATPYGPAYPVERRNTFVTNDVPRYCVRRKIPHRDSGDADSAVFCDRNGMPFAKLPRHLRDVDPLELLLEFEENERDYRASMAPLADDS